MGVDIKMRSIRGENISYEISDEAEKAADSAILYYGYLAYDGKWIIMENNTTNGTYRYKYGASAFSTSWAARESLSYGLFNTLVTGG